MAKPVKIASKFTSFHVLVHFYDENNFSILRLRDAVTANSPFFLNEENDLGSWDPSTKVESFFADAVYPAKFLQFGLNKSKMDITLDCLLNETLSPSDIEVLQKDELHKRRRDEISTDDNSTTKKPLKKNTSKEKAKEKQMLQIVKETISAAECSDCKLQKEKIGKMIEESINKEKELGELKMDLELRREKYKALKLKYKALKKNTKNIAVDAEKFCNEFTLIGPNTAVNTYKLTCCRIGNYSKYTADLLTVVFGPEVLKTSALKGISGCKKPPLDPVTISEIQMHVASKFNVTISQVRGAIRQKLNTSQKLKNV